MLEYLSDKVIEYYIKDEPANEIQKLILKLLKGKNKLPSEAEHSSIISFFEQTAEKSRAELDLFSQRLKSSHYQENIEPALKLAQCFFPEHKLDYSEAAVNQIRARKKLDIKKFNPDPITNPFKEVLFTANILLTMPADFNNLSAEIRSELKEDEKQKFYYDHPIPLDVEDQNNEIIYGLKELNQAVKRESSAELDLVLSVSCTHPSIKNAAKKYIKKKLEKLQLEHLNIFIFTENESELLLEKTIFPLLELEKRKEIRAAVGVDGKYGRHYSFLKAVALWWQRYLNPELKGTFKIDLDQVFDQQKLKQETGRYAFENFKSPLWGAEALDCQGRKVELGMIAGQLVNDSDIESSVYELDIKKPASDLEYDQYVFYKQKVQYISTAAEMGYRSENKNDTILRCHVTGGTNGILIDALKKYRPFCPTFIGRAEDQAYLLSVLFKAEADSYLRYYHQDGLIMRHDKQSFIPANIEKSKTSKLIGDYERILLFSHYAAQILDDFERIKNELFPFTAAFITDTPFLLIYFRSLLKAYKLAAERPAEAEEFLSELAERLAAVYQKMEEGCYQKRFEAEKRAWDNYYDILSQNKLSSKKLTELLEKIKL